MKVDRLSGSHSRPALIRTKAEPPASARITASAPAPFAICSPGFSGQRLHLVGKPSPSSSTASAHVTTWRQHIADVFSRQSRKLHAAAGGPASAYSLVAASLHPPRRHRAGDAPDHLVLRTRTAPADHRGRLARVEKNNALARALVLHQEPQAGRDLRVEEQLPGSAIITSTTSARPSRRGSGLRCSGWLMLPLAQHDAGAYQASGATACAAARRSWRCPAGGSPLPSADRPQAAMPPVADVERRVGDGTKSARRSGCWLLREGVGGSRPRLKSIPRMARFIAGQPPGGEGWIPGRRWTRRPACRRGWMNSLALHEHAAEPQQGRTPCRGARQPTTSVLTMLAGV